MAECGLWELSVSRKPIAGDQRTAADDVSTGSDDDVPVVSNINQTRTIDSTKPSSDLLNVSEFSTDNGRVQLTPPSSEESPFVLSRYPASKFSMTSLSPPSVPCRQRQTPYIPNSQITPPFCISPFRKITLLWAGGSIISIRIYAGHCDWGRVFRSSGIA